LRNNSFHRKSRLDTDCPFFRLNHLPLPGFEGIVQGLFHGTHRTPVESSFEMFMMQLDRGVCGDPIKFFVTRPEFEFTIWLRICSIEQHLARGDSARVVTL